MALNLRIGHFKAVMLMLSALASLNATLVLQQVRGQGQQPVAANGDGPPEVPLSQAQAMIAFPLYLPSDFPKGMRVRSAHVTHIHVINPTPEDWTKANSGPMHGFGILFSLQGGKVLARSLRGSPAEAAGLPPAEVELTTIDGGAAADAYANVKQFAHREPMVLTIKPEGGQERTITVPHSTDYTFHPDPQPVLVVPQDNYVCIYVDRGDNAMTLAEAPPSLSPYLPGETQTQINVSTADVAGKQVTFFGPTAAPSAYWTDTKAGVCFWADNHTGAVSKSELIRMITAMQKVP